MFPLADPSPAPSTVLVERPQRCFETEGHTLCRKVFDWTDNAWVAETAEWVVAKPLRIVAIIVLAIVLRRLVHRAIRRLASRAAEGSVPGVLTRGRPDSETALLLERRRQRAATMGSVLRSIATAVIYGVATLMALAELTFNIGPLIASAGIIGVALGFGAQSLVKDFLSGIFMVLEDQYGVGDEVDVGTATGTVEAVGLRVTRLRDLEGTVWYVRNGEILRLGNKSQGWARAVIDVDVAYGEDVPRVRARLADAGRKLMETESYAELILEEPNVLGVQSLGKDSVVVRVIVKTMPGKQGLVARAFRELIKQTMDEYRIENPFPQRTVWVRPQGPTGEQAPPGGG